MGFYHNLNVLLSHLLSEAVSHGIVVVTWGTFLIAGAISFWMEYVAHKQVLSVRSFLHYCFPWQEWEGKSARVDVCLYFIGKMTDRLIGAGGFVLVGTLAYYFSKYLDSVASTTVKAKGNGLTVVGLSILFFLAVDFSNYATHLMEHKIPLLWEFHKVHHSASFLSPLTTARIHPFERAFDSFFSALSVGIISGFAMHFYSFSIAELLGMVAAANTVATVLVLDPLRHSQFPISFGPLERFLLSPHMHQLHHSVKMEHWDRNMGNKLSVWDWFFRTGFKPERGESLRYGTGHDEDKEYESVVGCYILPLLKIYRMWTPAARPRDPAHVGAELIREAQTFKRQASQSIDFEVPWSGGGPGVSGTEIQPQFKRKGAEV